MQARVLHTYCWFSICHNFLQLAALALTFRVLLAAGTCLPHVLSVFYLLFFSSARCARTLCHRVVGCRHSLPHVLSAFYLLYFSSARCARTLCHRVVGCRHERYTLAVGFSVCYYCIFFFSSLRSHLLAGYCT